MAKRIYFTFPSIHFAIMAEMLLEDNPWRVRMLPVPRMISSSCGTALCCLPEDAGAVLQLLEEASVPLEGQYELDGRQLLGPLSLQSETPECEEAG